MCVAVADFLHPWRFCLYKKDRSSTSLTIFSLNLAENYQPVNELYQTADHPALSPGFSHPERQVNLADLGSPRGKPAENTRHLTWLVGGGDAWVRFGLAHFLQLLIVF